MESRCALTDMQSFVKSEVLKLLDRLIHESRQQSEYLDVELRIQRA